MVLCLFTFIVTNEANQLVGVLSLKQLLLSKTRTPIDELMTRDVLCVNVDTNQEDVAKMVEKYDFLSVPVVNPGNELMGVITVDDVLDVIRSESEEELLSYGRISVSIDAPLLEQMRDRIPWLSLAYLSGLVSLGLLFLSEQTQIDLFSQTQTQFLFSLLATLPLLLAIGATLGHQSVTFGIAALKGGKAESWNYLKTLTHEIKINFVLGIAFAALNALASYGFFKSSVIATILFTTTFFQFLTGSIIGVMIPYSLKKVVMDFSGFYVAIITGIIEVLTVFILMVSTHIVQS